MLYRCANRQPYFNSASAAISRKCFPNGSLMHEWQANDFKVFAPKEVCLANCSLDPNVQIIIRINSLIHPACLVNIFVDVIRSYIFLVILRDSSLAYFNCGWNNTRLSRNSWEFVDSHGELCTGSKKVSILWEYSVKLIFLPRGFQTRYML